MLRLRNNLLRLTAVIALASLAACGAKRGRATDGSALSVEAQVDAFAQDLANNRTAPDEIADRFDYSPEISRCVRTRSSEETITCATRGDFDVFMMRQRWGVLTLDRAGSTATDMRLCAARPIADAKRTVTLCATFAPVNDFASDAYDDVGNAIRQEGDAQDIHGIVLVATAGKLRLND